MVGAVVLAVVAWSSAGCGDTGAEAAGGRSGVVGRVLLGPQCPVESSSDPCGDAPAAGATVSVAERLGGGVGHVVARAETRPDGSYRVAVPPGRYVVTADAGMSCPLVDVRVTPGRHAHVDIACDTGIR